MDRTTFDRITRVLGSAGSRRAGLRMAAAALFGAGATRVVGPGTAAATPRPAGPCKSTKRQDNTCTKASQCCTGVCDTSKGATNKDGQGRCRCVRRGGNCTEDRNCCSRRGQQMTCIGGVCDMPATCLGLQAACVSGVDTCCAGECAQRPVSIAPRGQSAFVCCVQDQQSGCVVDADCCNFLATCNQGTCTYA
jgi:hypothetical protein